MYMELGSRDVLGVLGRSGSCVFDAVQYTCREVEAEGCEGAERPLHEVNKDQDRVCLVRGGRL